MIAMLTTFQHQYDDKMLDIVSEMLEYVILSSDKMGVSNARQRKYIIISNLHTYIM